MIRRWLPFDRFQLVRLILDYLNEVQNDYDYEPTIENANYLFGIGLTHALIDQPVLVAVENNNIVGWTCWIPAISHILSFKESVLIGMGTYVIPEWRRKGIARNLHTAAEDIAREEGYTRVDRIGSGTGEAMLLRDGWKPAATVYHKEL